MSATAVAAPVARWRPVAEAMGKIGAGSLASGVLSAVAIKILSERYARSIAYHPSDAEGRLEEFVKAHARP